MKDKFAEAPSGSFNSMSAHGLSDEARHAVNAAFDALSTWRSETVDNSEKNIEQVIEKMAAAARALKWPEQIVDATRAQMQSVTKMQIQVMDQVMSAWEEQIKSPNPMAGFPSEMMSKLRSLSGFHPTSGWPNAEALQNMTLNPVQFWMQLGQQWQKSWTDAMSMWARGGRPDDTRRR